MQTYAHTIRAEQQDVKKFPTRFAAIDSLFSAVTAAGVVIDRAAIPGDSGLDAMMIFAEAGSEDAFLISRINDNTFMILRRPRPVG